MATKNQLALLLLMCAVTALLIQPAMGQKDALRWGKRGSELSDDYAENPQTFQRYHHDDDYSRRFLRKGLGSNITDLWNFQTRDEYLVNTHVRGLPSWNYNQKMFWAIHKHKWPQSSYFLLLTSFGRNLTRILILCDFEPKVTAVFCMISLILSRSSR